jgi:Tol biopolymer transport system component
MKRMRRIGVLFLIATAILACDLPVNLATTPATIPVATIVAQTMQAIPAIVSPSASPATTAIPTQSASPASTPTTVSDILPHALYFLNNDKNGLLQIFRLERDGKTIHQITFEPANVNSYDISPKDGSIVYVSNNQMFLVDVNGAGRRMLVDGGPVNDNNRFTNSVGSPVWSPDGKTIAFSHGGLNFYSVDSGAIQNVLANQIDNSAGFPIVRELYSPAAYSPDGSKLLINIGFYEGGTLGIYYPSHNALVRFNRADGGNVCCSAAWVPDGSGLYSASSVIGMIDSGLWYINAANGNATTLLPGSAPDGTYNFAQAPQIGPDGKLYFFFNNLPQIPTSGHTPMYLVRSGTDGVTGRTQLKPDLFQNINEVLWAPDVSFAVVAFAPVQDVYQGGEAEIVYPDARPNVVLTDFAMQMKWEP